MKCAIELITIKEVAEENHKIEEKRKDLMAFKEFVEIAEKTINLCENDINDALVYRAENRYANIRVEYLIDYDFDRLGNKLFRFVTEDTKKYKDGSSSFSPCWEVYSFDTLKNYIESHCLEVSTERVVKRRYGYGERNYTRLIIKVPTI